MKYLIGQRVILNNEEIGTVVVGPEKPTSWFAVLDWETPPEPNTERDTWVYSPIKGFASYYSNHNIRPLPNNQL